MGNSTQGWKATGMDTGPSQAWKLGLTGPHLPLNWPPDVKFHPGVPMCTQTRPQQVEGPA